MTALVDVARYSCRYERPLRPAFAALAANFAAATITGRFREVVQRHSAGAERRPRDGFVEHPVAVTVPGPLLRTMATPAVLLSIVTYAGTFLSGRAAIVFQNLRFRSCVMVRRSARTVTPGRAVQ